ncbi:probable transcription factor At1g61730 [Ipomoea triloba]|uniref:probable transcription factor At1g61730 n=1 Tax=Ipomoea triloba TaxID=35885 RepID=UPI00125E3EC3|nr:probable transcription factor At1g61730 [Ipomoea triloba]
MAKTRSELKKSVAEEEEEEDCSTDNEGSESDSESESEQEQTQTQMQIAKTPSSAATKVTEASSTQAKVQAASSSETDSDSESESERPAPIVKPTDHPRESAQSKPRKSGAEAKRPADREATESKRQKRNPESVVEISEIKPSEEESKKQLFQRLWSEDDEIGLLEGMIEYTEKENGDPHTDLDAFHDFIRKSVHFTVSKSQLQNKMKRMRKNYINNAGKGKLFSKPHEQKTYQLSRKIWGKGDEKIKDSNQVRIVHALMACNGSLKEEKINKNKAPVVEDAIETHASSGWKMGRFNLLSQFMEKNKGIVIGEEKRKEIEKKRKAVAVAEMDLFLKELELIQEHVKASLNAMKKK